MGDELIHLDGQTDMVKVLLATYSDVPRNRCHMNAVYKEKNCNL